MASKKSGVYVVRNSKGQFLGTFFATSEREAIQKLNNSMAATASTFRKSQPAPKLYDLTAKIEDTSK